MDPLKRYDLAAEFRDNAPVREYHEFLAEKGYPQKLLDAAPRAEQLLAAHQKLAARIQKEYPIAGNQNRPPWLQDAIGQLHRNYVRPLRDRLASLPQRMRDMAQKIRDAKPPDFKFYSPETLAKLDIGRCDSLMSELAWLDQFPERVAGEEALIVEWLNSPSGGGQGSTPPTPQFAPRPSPDDPDDGGKVISDNWDPRRS